MTGPVSTPDSAADLRRKLIAEFDGHPSEWVSPNEFGGYDVDNAAAADIALAVVRDHVTDVHTRNANLRSEHRAEVERLTEDNERLGALYGLAERQYGEVTGELRADLKRYEGALDSAQRGLIRMETQRDDLRLAVLQAAGVDPDTANEDTDYAAILTDLRAEVARLSAESLTIPDDAADERLDVDELPADRVEKLANWLHGRNIGICEMDDDVVYNGLDSMRSLARELLQSGPAGIRITSAVTNPTGAPAAEESDARREVSALLVHPAAWDGVVRFLDQRGIDVDPAGDLEGIPTFSMGIRSLDVPAAPSPAGDATPDTEAREDAEDREFQETFRPVLPGGES